MSATAERARRLSALYTGDLPEVLSEAEAEVATENEIRDAVRGGPLPLDAYGTTMARPTAPAISAAYASLTASSG